MTIYYVATNGSDSGTGSASSPWRTIGRATGAPLKPGDEVVVRPGTYREQVFIDNDGVAGSQITFRAETPGETLIRPPSGAYSTVHIKGNYVTFEGFDVQGGGGHAIEAHGVHHANIVNNIAHDSGGSGISAGYGDYFLIEGNVSFNNASTNGYHTSGISVYQARNISGDASTDGYRIILRNNISYNNTESSAIASEHTDGNGIIIDDFQNTQGGSSYGVYKFKTLLDGNLVYGNGGKGIQVVWSDNVTVRNNTAYHNNQDPLSVTWWRGELSNSQSTNNVWVNNIAVADPDANADNTAIANTAYNSYKNNVIWANNITYNGQAGDQSVLAWDAPQVPASQNKLGIDPRLVDPASGNFSVGAGSPAIDAGTTQYGAGSTDLDGDPRVVGTIDIGAYERASTGSTNRAPVANPDSGFTTTANTAVTISKATLLENDTDADGNALTLTGLSSPSNGSVRVDGNNVIFTPNSGYTGAAGFTYSISDGQGGTNSATVGLTVSAAGPSNAAPTFTSGNAFSLNENIKAIGSVAAGDAEGDTLTFAKAGGADAALFTVNSATGAISFVNAPDFEKPADADGNNVYLLGVSVTDGKHTPVSTTLQISVKNVAESTPPVPTGSTFFAPSAVPAGTETKDTTDYELGMKFRPLANGEITALRYYRGAADANDTDTRTLHLWTGGGKELAEISVSSAPGATGWQTATLSTPVKVTAQSLYVVSYGTTQNYADTVNYFGSAMTNADGTLSVPSGAAGVFNARGGAGTGPDYFPTNTWNASNYWADVIFKASSASASASASAPAALTLTGTDGRDTLIGGAVNDTISGLKGNDRIQGNGGADILTGGGGYDTFVYVSVSDSTPAAPDTIRSFGRGYDKIDLTAIDAVAGGGNNAFIWIGTDAFSGAEGQLRTQSTSSGLVLQGDVNGDGTADISIALEASYHTIQSSDVLL